jgi:hypothetical protein
MTDRTVAGGLAGLTLAWGKQRGVGRPGRLWLTPRAFKRTKDLPNKVPLDPYVFTVPNCINDRPALKALCGRSFGQAQGGGGFLVIAAGQLTFPQFGVHAP